MRLLHYGAKPGFVADFNKKYPVDRDGMKPCGLWVSVEGEYDWLWWCRAEQFRLNTLTHMTEVILKPDANILLIDNLDMLDAFHKRYHKEIYPGSASKGIDWKQIKDLYDGIIIAPYQWERRLGMDMLWYYGWDCASGCIWNLKAAVDLVRYVGPTPAEADPFTQAEQANAGS